MMRGPRDLERAKRLEVGLVGLRWFVVAFGVLQTVLSLRVDREAPDYVVPTGFALVAALAIGNVMISSAAERAERAEDLRRLGLWAFLLDIVVITGLVWTASTDPEAPVWVLAYLLPLEGAVRYQLPGAIVPVLVSAVSEPLREALVLGPVHDHGFHLSFVALRVGIQLVVALVAGLMARSLRRAADEAGERAWLAEEAARLAEGAAAREAAARRELAAYHTAVLAGVAVEDVAGGLQSMAESIARDLQLEEFGILLLDGPDLVAEGVHGDPGYARGDRIELRGHRFARVAGEGRPLLRPVPGDRERVDVAVALTVGGETIGVLHERGVGNEEGPPRVERLARLADQIALVVHAVRLRARQEETLRRLRELDDMKSDFVAITSHELRTPLSAIRGFVNTMVRRMDQLTHEEVREFLGIVDEQSTRLGRLVEDLLVVSRIEAGKLSFSPELVAIGPFLEEVARAFGGEGPRLQLVHEDDAAQELVVDRHRLTQVLTNLLENALKFSPLAEPVTLRVARAGDGVAFSVEDRGVGIPPEELGRIFERFHQSDAATTREAEGAGLGLYITRRLTEAMGGRVQVASAVGRGSTFTITLPTGPVPPSPARPFAGARAD